MAIRREPIWKRGISLLLSLASFAMLTPMILRWTTSQEVPLQEGRVGVVFWDHSASVASMQPEKEILKKAWSTRANLEWIEFSDTCLPPFGEGVPLKGTQLFDAMAANSDHLDQLAPDWICVVSDGGFHVPKNLPEYLKNTPLYLSTFNVKRKSDLAIDGIHTDPVWYARSDSTVVIDLSRSDISAPSTVDVLVSLDGHMVGTFSATFKNNELHTQAEVTVKAQHMGALPLEVRIAEGQGGAYTENDQFLHTCQVIRDRVRILRVVGRPNWSSKFLRDELVQREDVDLVDFHILRAMQDRVLANSDELALIPFPVEELFVENIESFDLIIWQNFDHESYPFFKPEYVRNIQKAVESGCGVLLLNGSLPWSLESDAMGQIAPVATNGDRHEIITGRWEVNPAEFIQPDMAKTLQQAPDFSMRVFTGQLNAKAQTILSLKGHPILASLKVGQGRVIQICTDELWRWKFSPPQGHERVYSELLKLSLLWLQHHPGMEHRDFDLPDHLRTEELTEVNLTSLPHQNGSLIWSQLDGSEVQRTPVLKGQRTVSVKTPSEPGAYFLRLNDQHPKRIFLKGLQGEILSPQELTKRQTQCQELGFSILKDLEAPPYTTNGDKGFVRSSGEPWYQTPWFLATFVALMTMHWLLLNRCLGQRP